MPARHPVAGQTARDGCKADLHPRPARLDVTGGAAGKRVHEHGPLGRGFAAVGGVVEAEIGSRQLGRRRPVHAPFDGAVMARGAYGRRGPGIEPGVGHAGGHRAGPGPRSRGCHARVTPLAGRKQLCMPGMIEPVPAVRPARSRGGRGEQERQRYADQHAAHHNVAHRPDHRAAHRAGPSAVDAGSPCPSACAPPCPWAAERSRARLRRAGGSGSRSAEVPSRAVIRR